MSETVDKIFNKLDDLAADMATIKANTATATEVSKDHECRLRGLERWQWMVVGIATAVGALSSVAVAFLTR